ISEQKPMHIDVDVRNNQLTIINQIQEKGNKPNSSQIGLKNLTERFQLITGNPIKAYRENGKFIVSLPLTPLNSHENNNN
ncbi:MAG: hypothetical protein RIF39_18365, partial [Cyclobacteriaceae bacterium]